MSDFTNDNLRWIVESGNGLEARLARELLKARKPAEEPYPPKLEGPRCGHEQKPPPAGEPWIASFPCPYPECPEGTPNNRWHKGIDAGRHGVVSDADSYNGKHEELVYERRQYRFTSKGASEKGYDFDGYAWELMR